LNISETPFPKHDSYQVWLKLGPVVLEKKSIKGKANGRRRRMDYDGNSSPEPKLELPY